MPKSDLHNIKIPYLAHVHLVPCGIQRHAAGVRARSSPLLLAVTEHNRPCRPQSQHLLPYKYTKYCSPNVHGASSCAEQR